MNRNKDKAWYIADVGDDLIYIAEKLNTKANSEDYHFENELLMLKEVLETLESLECLKEHSE
ncbi:hypothetical protein [Mammaliicoccus stepanovicii]|uniref:Uncharacterized protein n=1 Tax=Mammaliicoccus stepanovicii TaxID=643214 RepID=A0A239ZWS0_9STAP|nr:hypothetical protein [Mammaliicoccus stepanovicii]PNZ77414.1 hypothetical protein CD111_04405 [Mammaliicoccus stepanovicii]GGI39075.1 hypothetical protein GCM10010896_01570 [Mammaliicoccus stepanovicii]SNV75146.1 Uncharacterised protein [Mammaliicoccus stepanovicii]